MATPSSASDVGLALKKLVELLGAPGTKVTTAVFAIPAKAALTVTVSATVLFKVTEQLPAPVVAHVVALNV